MLGLKCVFDFMEKYDKVEKLPTVLLGDFNAEPKECTIQLAVQEKGLFDSTKDVFVTYHEYGKEQTQIDYIFLSEELKERVDVV